MTIFINARFLTQMITGVQRYALECSRQIKQMYPDTILVAPKNIVHQDLANELGVITIGNNTGHLWEQLDLPLYLKKQKSSVLLNLANTAPLFYKNNYITIHDLAFHFHPEWNSRSFSTWYNFLIPRIARRAKHIFTVSGTIKDEIANNIHINTNAISVTYNGLSKAILSTTPTEIKEKIILAVGSFNTRKNHNKLIQAFILSNISKTHTLVIVGDKHEVFKKMELDDAAIKQNNIQIMERLSESELIHLYQRSEIVVSLSSYEGFGIPVLEGLYFNSKVLCADIPVYRELFDNYVYFCDIKSIDDISYSLQKIAYKPSLAHGIEELLKKYNYTNSAKIILNKIL